MTNPKLQEALDFILDDGQRDKREELADLALEYRDAEVTLNNAGLRRAADKMGDLASAVEAMLYG